MASVSSLGAGSGLNLSGLLENLMKAERQPKEALLNSQLSSYNSKISGLGTLSSKLANLQTAIQALKPSVLQTAAEKFASYTGSLDDKVGKVTVGAGAVAGNYNLIVTQLAQGQKSVTDVVSGNLAINDTLEIGFTKDDGSSSNITITITENTKTLEGLRNAINAKQGESGVSATIINDGKDKRLVLNGADGKKFTTGGNALVFDQSKEVQPKKAEFSLDGIALTSSSNKITGVIEGVTLDLVGKTDANGVTLSIQKEGESKLKSALEAFVNAYNDANSSMTALGAYNAETKVAGALQGNSILRDTRSTLSRMVFDTGLGSGLDKQTLSSIGISISKTGDGSLSLDADKLAEAVAKDPEAVANLAAHVGNEFDKELSKFVGLGGRIQASTDSLRTSVRDVEKRQEALELRMQQIEARYRAQFTALDTLVTKMNSLSNSLAGSLGSLMTSYASTSR